MFTVQRQLIAQSFQASALPVTVAPTPIQANVDLTQLIDSFAITVPTGISIFLGNAGVAVGTGLELLGGTGTQFIIDHGGRQLYELQAPIIEIDGVAQCRSINPEAIPFVVWDLSQIFVVAAAPVAATIAIFRAMYI